MTLTGNNIQLVDSGTLNLNSVYASGNVTLAADQLNNTGGNGAITAGGTWNIYLTNLDGNMFDGLDSRNQAIWGMSYGDSVTETGNRYIFATAENLSITPEATPFAVSKTGGDVATLPTPTADTNYEVNGFVDARIYGAVFTQDEVTNVTINGLSFTSTGAPANAAEGVYDVTMTGTGSSTNGYSISFSPVAQFGVLTVNGNPVIPTPLTPSTPIPPTPPVPPLPPANNAIPTFANPAVSSANVPNANPALTATVPSVTSSGSVGVLNDCMSDNGTCFVINPNDIAG